MEPSGMFISVFVFIGFAAFIILICFVARVCACMKQSASHAPPNINTRIVGASTVSHINTQFNSPASAMRRDYPSEYGINSHPNPAHPYYHYQGNNYHHPNRDFNIYPANAIAPSSTRLIDSPPSYGEVMAHSS